MCVRYVGKLLVFSIHFNIMKEFTMENNAMSVLSVENFFLILLFKSMNGFTLENKFMNVSSMEKTLHSCSVQEH